MISDFPGSRREALPPLLPLNHRQDQSWNALVRIAHLLGRPADERALLRQVLVALEDELGWQAAAVSLTGLEGIGDIQEGPGAGKTASALSPFPTVPEAFPAPAPGLRPGAPQSLTVPLALDNGATGAMAVWIPDAPPPDGPEGDSSGEDACRLLEVVAAMVANMLNARQAATHHRQVLEKEIRSLQGLLGEGFRPETLLGESRLMRRVYQRIHQVADGDTPALILGEAGTGKELIAAAIHYLSPRANGPFVKVHCAALSEGLLERELFGYEQSAGYARMGRLEEAEGGAVFFDEIALLAPDAQARVARLLQDREYERLGGTMRRKADVRILAATTRDLDREVEAGRFRQDLYYGVNVFPIPIPPLRERKDDIPLLAQHFVDKIAGRRRQTVRRISATAIDLLQAYHWPGNVRELESCVERALLAMDGDVLRGVHLPPALQAPDERDGPPLGAMQATINILEKEMLSDALRRRNGNASAAARDLGITARMVRYRMEKLGIDPRACG